MAVCGYRGVWEPFLGSWDKQLAYDLGELQSMLSDSQTATRTHNVAFASPPHDHKAPVPCVVVGAMKKGIKDLSK